MGWTSAAAWRRTAARTTEDPGVHRARALVERGAMKGRFGRYGGRFLPEAPMPAPEELQAAHERASAYEAFQAELDGSLRRYCGRPTSLYHAERLSSSLAGPRIYLKREDLLHTGAHKINNTMGQVLLARRMGKARIIAETG